MHVRQRAYGCVLGFICMFGMGCGNNGGTPTASIPLKLIPQEDVAEATHDQVVALCAACHNYPPADSFPKHAWESEVKRGFRFYQESRLALNPPPVVSVIKYYENRAPAALPMISAAAESPDKCCRFERRGLRPPSFPLTPTVSNVRCVHLFDDKQLEILVCEDLRGQIWLLRPEDPDNPWQLLSDGLAHPAHVEVIDLDQDGIKDLIVAELGSFLATDEKQGRVLWLRGTKDGKFEKHVLASKLGRVADVQAADFNGDGKLDLVVAEFGWQRVGSVMLLENQTTDYAKPNFIQHVLDERHGTIHVPVVDLNGDGKPDFIALISQEHEKVVAFINEGNFKFKQEVIFDGPHPAFGSSGIQLVDFDGDGMVDVLYTNGDTLDLTLLRPYHGVHVLMNRGKYPFEDHAIGPMYGVHRALAADFEGRGQKDIIAVSFMPEPGYTELRESKDVDAIVYFRQTAPYQFTRHVLERRTCDHATADVGDFNGDGMIDFVVGNFSLLATRQGDQRSAVTHPESTDMVAVWRNLGIGKTPQK